MADDFPAIHGYVTTTCYPMANVLPFLLNQTRIIGSWSGMNAIWCILRLRQDCEKQSLSKLYTSQAMRRVEIGVNPLHTRSTERIHRDEIQQSDEPARFLTCSNLFPSRASERGD